MAAKSLLDIQRKPIEQRLAALKAKSNFESGEAGTNLVREAREYGLGLRDFLKLAVDVRGSAENDNFRTDKGFLNGYEAALAYLGLPVRDDFENGMVLDLASDTFQTFPGTRALFPEVVDDMVKWKYRQDNFETPAALVSSSRTINGVEMISTVVDDKEADYQGTQAVAEFGRVPVKTIRTTQTSVGIFKHGGGYRVSYEFQRRARIDLLTPFAIRMNREMERSKTWAATEVLVNGDGVNEAAPVVAQSSFTATGVAAATAGTIGFKQLMLWLISRAKAGTPIDTVVGDWDAYVQWLLMFALPSTDKTRTDAEQLAATGFQVGGVPILQGRVNFALSSAAPQGKLIGFSKGDTLDELIEAGSLIDESERSITNQSVTYVKTENAGYKLNFGDTRSVFNYAA